MPAASFDSFGRSIKAAIDSCKELCKDSEMRNYGKTHM